MGLMIARNLLAAGRQVTLYDKGKVGAESSWAGGGILSPLYPWRYPQSVTELALRSQTLYPDLTRALYNNTGIDPELTQTGLLVLSVADPGMAQDWADHNRVKIRVVGPDHVAELEPNLATTLTKQALVFPDIGHIRNPRLISALRADLLENSCELRENTEILGIISQKNKLQKLVTTQGDVNAEQVIVCAGAWTGQLLKGLGLGIPVEPVAGQMLLYKAKPGLVNHIILNKKRYLIPRRDGRVLVGSTLENAGFNKFTTDEARESLQKTALEMVPELAEYNIEAQWAGLRPGSPRGIPYMGVYPGIKNLWVCAGHFRNGLVMAPASAEFMTALVLDQKTNFSQPEFALDRVS